MSNAMVEKFREVLLPTVPYQLAADPMKVAWEFKGVEVEYLPRQWRYWWYRGAGIKLLLLAIATLQAQGIPATRRSIVDQLGGTMAYTTVGGNLSRMTNVLPAWYQNKSEYVMHTPMPLIRIKKGRRYEYYIVEPAPTA